MNRLENGSIALEEVFSITNTCSQIYNTFKGITLQKRQTMEFQCASIEHDCIISDKTRLNRVLTNLLGNAVKFTPDGGKIIMLLEEVRRQNDKIVIFRITIKDTGIGIAEEHLDSIFEAFNRAENTNIHGIEGTGLGLAIVKAIVDSQGGVISVKSKKGVGSTFTVEVPILVVDTLTEHTPALLPIKSCSTNLNSKHILLVEDHPVNILVASKMLQKMGATVSSTANGKEGYDLFYNSPPKTFDLIFMDLQMPLMDGYAAQTLFVTVTTQKQRQYLLLL